VDRRVLIILVAAVVLGGVVIGVLVARGGGDSSPSSDLTDTKVKPVIEVPDDPPPTKLETKDIVEGHGPAAKKGDQLTVQYVGVDYDTGKEFDSSWSNGQPFPVQLGTGQVIQGWDEGVAGMKVGGRRELTIPPDLAYGASGSPPAIGPNATLVFVIDLLSIK
jgi:peptidylprolyl isomerase